MIGEHEGHCASILAFSQAASPYLYFHWLTFRIKKREHGSRGDSCVPASRTRNRFIRVFSKDESQRCINRTRRGTKLSLFSNKKIMKLGFFFHRLFACIHLWIRLRAIGGLCLSLRQWVDRMRVFSGSPIQRIGIFRSQTKCRVPRDSNEERRHPLVFLVLLFDNYNLNAVITFI